jgi:hypothetical protein
VGPRRRLLHARVAANQSGVRRPSRELERLARPGGEATPECLCRDSLVAEAVSLAPCAADGRRGRGNPSRAPLQCRRGRGNPPRVPLQ